MLSQRHAPGLPFYRKTRDDREGNGHLGDLRGLQAADKTSTVYFQNLSPQSRAFKSNKLTAFSSWCYFQFAGKEEVISLERMYEDREQFSDKIEVTKKKSKRFLRIRHLLWTQPTAAQCTGGRQAISSKDESTQ